MGMEKAGIAPYAGMVIVQLAQVGLMIACKIAMSNGMTTFTFACYSNAFASLLLLPISYFIYSTRSNRPALFPCFLCGFFLLGFLGFLVQILGYSGIKYASATLSTSMLNLIPGFTFVFAVILRELLDSVRRLFLAYVLAFFCGVIAKMYIRKLFLRLEKFSCRSLTTLAKCIGTLVSIAGALILTLYQGSSILGPPPHSNASSHTIKTSSAWLLGGLLLFIDTVVSSLFIIAQALVLKKFPAELILMFFYSSFISILSAAVSLVMEKDHSAWSLKGKMRLIPVIYSALFGNVFQVSIIMWCVRRKGPLFASVFHPLGVIFAIAMGIILLGESLYLGSVVGSIIAVIGFYSVMWGKAKEAKDNEEVKPMEEPNAKRMPLLQNNTDDGAIQA